MLLITIIGEYLAAQQEQDITTVTSSHEEEPCKMSHS